MADVRVMKLVSSEEIILDFVREEDDCYVIKNPFCIAPSLTPNSKVSVFPWSIATSVPNDNEYRIGKQFVMLLAQAPEGLASSFIGQTTGLTVPPAGLITG